MFYLGERRVLRAITAWGGGSRRSAPARGSRGAIARAILSTQTEVTAEDTAKKEARGINTALLRLRRARVVNSVMA